MQCIELGVFEHFLEAAYENGSIYGYGVDLDALSALQGHCAELRPKLGLDERHEDIKNRSFITSRTIFAWDMATT